MIPGTTEFFISVSDHSEWGTAHSVWGRVHGSASWDTIHKIVALPYHEFKHPEVRLLKYPEVHAY